MKTREELKAAILALECHDVEGIARFCPWCEVEGEWGKDHPRAAEHPLPHTTDCLWLELKNEPVA